MKSKIRKIILTIVVMFIIIINSAPVEADVGSFESMIVEVVHGIVVVLGTVEVHHGIGIVEVHIVQAVVMILI